MIISFEPTGSYSDSLRQSLHKAGLTVHQVRGKVSHDYLEVFDGVPLKHDAKDAAVKNNEAFDVNKLFCEKLSQKKLFGWERQD